MVKTNASTLENPYYYTITTHSLLPAGRLRPWPPHTPRSFCRCLGVKLHACLERTECLCALTGSLVLKMKPLATALVPRKQKTRDSSCATEQTFVPRFTPTRAHLCFLYTELQGRILQQAAGNPLPLRSNCASINISPCGLNL